MTKFYQHDCDVIEQARVLVQYLVEDSPFGNDEEAWKWVRQTYPQIIGISEQTTVDEDRRAVGDLG